MRPALLSHFCLLPGIPVASVLCTALSAGAAPARQGSTSTAAPPRLWSDLAAWLASPMTPAKLVIATAFTALLLYIALKLFSWARHRANKKKAASAADKGKVQAAPSVLEEAKAFFVRVQDAWDRRDLDALAGMATPAMLDEIMAQVEASPEPSPSDILWVKAELVSQSEKEGQQQMLVYFTFLLQEEPKQGETVEAREIWRLLRPLSGGSWLLDSIHHVKG